MRDEKKFVQDVNNYLIKRIKNDMIYDFLSNRIVDIKHFNFHIINEISLSHVCNKCDINLTVDEKEIKKRITLLLSDELYHKLEIKEKKLDLIINDIQNQMNIANELNANFNDESVVELYNMMYKC